MKQSGTFPKCESKDVILIPGSRASQGGNSIRKGAFNLTQILVSRYLCITCGYSEEWVDDVAKRQWLKEKHV